MTVGGWKYAIYFQPLLGRKATKLLLDKKTLKVARSRDHQPVLPADDDDSSMNSLIVYRQPHVVSLGRRISQGFGISKVGHRHVRDYSPSHMRLRVVKAAKYVHWTRGMFVIRLVVWHPEIYSNRNRLGFR